MQREYGRNIGSKWRREDKKREKELKRLQELAEIRAQAAEMRYVQYLTRKNAALNISTYVALKL